ncbi:serine hydrolase [Sphingobacterium kyonggiense]|uniref:Serine hydrolase n=1 Tax=Sphingobacterium kyonggiense TaxID=714075 RepID=A0ABP7YNS4_9SPHI
MMPLRVIFLYSLFILVVLNSCKLSRFVYYNTANITDYKIFPSRTANNSNEHFNFLNAKQTKVPKSIQYANQDYPFEDFLKEQNTVAFLVIQRDSLLYEQYWDGYTDSSMIASFSMAKSITSILIGCAIEDKLIESVEEPITRYIPELKANGFDDVKIKHLLQMTSGLDFREGYINPFGEVASFYYGTNLTKAIGKLKLKRKPGEAFEYVSGNTQLLGFVLDRALKDQSITSYLEEKLWKPMGMEYPATWSLDRKNGIEKTFCCINARARDFAKLGRLYLNKGNWNGKQLVPVNWVKESTKAEIKEGSVPYYQYQWWLPSNNGEFIAQGILGQFIYVNPQKDLIIVRLGKKQGKVDWWKVFSSLGQIY